MAALLMRVFSWPFLNEADVMLVNVANINEKVDGKPI